MQIIEFLGVGLVAGWIMGKVRKGKNGYGLLKSLVIGVIGSFIGWFFMGFLRVESPNLLTELAMAVLGAAVFFFVVGLFSGKKKKKSSEEDEE